MRLHVTAWLIGLLLLFPAAAQETEQGKLERVQLRVVSVSPGVGVVIDRGSSDGLERGDPVRFTPRGDAPVRGVIVQVDDRSAVVQLLAGPQLLEPGTPGVARVPASRLVPVVPPPPAAGQGPAPAPQATTEGAPEAGQEEPEHDPWEYEDDEWGPGDPLLAGVSAMRPEDRDMRVSGRVYVSGDATWASEGPRNDAWVRAGTSLALENPFGRGGEMLIDGEVNYRWASLPDEIDQSFARALVHRLSYRDGGTRFESNRWEAGRFLSNGMPEFGVIDGFEWGTRRDSGDRWGASIGFMPEEVPDFESVKTFQLSGYYEWVRGEQEQLTFGGGFQKTFHNGVSDRDLLLAKIRYLPLDGWDFHTTAWVDFYEGNDNAKNKVVELTQAWVTLARHFDSGDGVELTFRHLRLPELLRNEFTPVTANELADNRYDRVSVEGWKWFLDDYRFHSQVGLYNDEDDSGGNFEVGLEAVELFHEEGRVDLTVFGTVGSFNTTVGARARIGEQLQRAGWDLFYEAANSRQDGFSDTFDDILQHRVRGSLDFRWASGWDLNLALEGNLWDDEVAGSVSFYLQKGF